MSNLDEMLDRAFFAYNQKEYDEAEDLARQVLTLAPANGDGLYLLGLIASRMGAYEPAEKLLYQAVQLYKDNKQYKLSLGFVLEKQGRLDEALSFYEPYKEDAFVLSEIGFIYLQKGQPDFANSAFDKALSLCKDVLTAYIGKSIILRRQDKVQQAMDLLQEALNHGQSAELYYQLAKTARALFSFKLAKNYIQQAIQMDAVATFYNEQGLIEEGLELNESAKLSYELAIEKNAYLADAYANLGNLYFKENELKKAEDAYKRALGVDKDFLNAHHNLALVLYAENRLTEALEHLRSVIILEPNHTSGLYNLAIILEETGDYSEAAGLYFNLLSQQKEIQDLEFRIQNVLTLLAKGDKKDKKQALSFAKGWVKSFPSSVVGRYLNASLTGEKVSKELSTAYAEALYDAFAPSYDKKMEKLESKTLSEIKALLPKKAKNILDLGCGTGGLTTVLKAGFDVLVGVDISKQMLALAEQKGGYTKLYHQDVLSFIKEDTSCYDLIVASEVTPYFSDIEAFLIDIKERLALDGSLILTFELGANEQGVQLSESSRFVYEKGFLERLFQTLGFQVLVQKEVPLRKEGDSFANGLIVQLKKQD